MLTKLLQTSFIGKSNRANKFENTRVCYQTLAKDTFTPNFKSETGNILHTLIASGETEEVIIEKMQKAIAAESDVNLRDEFGKTPLYKACKARLNKVRDFLLGEGANPEQLVTPFNDLRVKPRADFADRIEAETEESGLRPLLPFIKACREFDYWKIISPVLPNQEAIALYRSTLGDVKPFSKNFKDEGELSEFLKQRSGVHQWKIETKEGLKALVSELKKYYTSILQS